VSAAQYVLALDQGTTSSRSLLIDAEGRIAALAQREFTQHFPRPGWVEHDATEIWETQLATMAEALRSARATPRDVAAVGITNQRETTVLWDRRTGRAGGARDRMAGPADGSRMRAAACRWP
jgi:glycerol kinase